LLTARCLGACAIAPAVIYDDDIAGRQTAEQAIAKLTAYTRHGTCIPCRAGTVEMYQLLTRIVERKATFKDLEQLEELCDLVRHASLCGLGQTAPNPVLNTLRYFKNEYLELLQPEGDNSQDHENWSGATADVSSSPH
jgi:bidirectional [NiFe] hydrogenase diaphorase subunit